MPTARKGRPLPRSCVTCNRRKVKCDRVQPSCGRCNTAGSACIYPTGDGPSKDAANIRSSSSERRPIAPATAPTNAPSIAPASTNHTPLSILPGPQTPKNAIPVHNGSIVDSSATKVRELEKKMIQLENLLKRPRESMGEAESSFVDSSFVEQDHILTRDAPSTKRQTKEETVVRGLLAGKGFKTKYYGASNASSLLAEVSSSSSEQQRQD